MPLPRIAVPARAIVDAAPLYRREDSVRALVAAAVQGGHCTPDELSGVLDAAARRGSAILPSHALDDVRDGGPSIARGSTRWGSFGVQPYRTSSSMCRFC